jgi:LDH2 family malate/lactate/ureidoglycolate dehydrogenase
MTASPTIVETKALEGFCAHCYELSGIAGDAASIAAEIVVRTTLRGVDTHGIKLFPEHLKRIREGAINPRARPTVVTESAATAVMEANAGLGQVAALEATRLAMGKASDVGCATVLVRNSNHLGASGTYALKCAEAGMIGIVATNGHVSLRVTGGLGPGLSSGTRAYGIPGKDYAVLLDVSMAPSGQKIREAIERGALLPEGWLEDAEGRPTTDPREFWRGGARIPIGDHKGYGMALVVEILVAALSGGHLAWDAGLMPGRDDAPWNLGHAMVVLDVASFMPLEKFVTRVQDVIDHVKRSPLRAGSDRILIPGERAAETEARRREEGIPLDASVWRRLHEEASILRCGRQLEAIRK